MVLKPEAPGRNWLIVLDSSLMQRLGSLHGVLASMGLGWRLPLTGFEDPGNSMWAGMEVRDGGTGDLH